MPNRKGTNCFQGSKGAPKPTGTDTNIAFRGSHNPPSNSGGGDQVTIFFTFGHLLKTINFLKVVLVDVGFTKIYDSYLLTN